MNEFSRRLKRLRAKRGLSQVELAKKIGIDRQTVIVMENEGKLPTGNNLIKLAEELETSIDYLVCLTEYEPSEFNQFCSIYRGLSAESKLKLMNLCIRLSQEEGNI